MLYIHWANLLILTRSLGHIFTLFFAQQEKEHSKDLLNIYMQERSYKFCLAIEILNFL